MILPYIENANFEDTGFAYTYSLIAGKYKMVILYCLMEFQPVRFNQLQRYVRGVSDKMLSQSLKELRAEICRYLARRFERADGLVRREVWPETPPRVEYSLTPKGSSLMAVLDELCTWGEKHRDEKAETPAE